MSESQWEYLEDKCSDLHTDLENIRNMAILLTDLEEEAREDLRAIREAVRVIKEDEKGE